MSNSAPQLVEMPWNHCNILGGDGLWNVDYVGQERIVAEVERRLSVVEEFSALVESNLKRGARLRQSILQQAFEGKLVRV